MGKKKTQQRVQQSMSQMVSKAAIAQLGPAIEDAVRYYVNQAAGQLARNQVSTLETLYARVVVLEEIVMEKLGYTNEELTNKVADLQDKNEGFEPSLDGAKTGDTVRLTIETKAKDQTEFQGLSKVRLKNAGSGQTLGPELEAALIGMKAGETKEITFGAEKDLQARIVVAKVSTRPAPEAAPQEEAKNETQG